MPTRRQDGSVWLSMVGVLAATDDGDYAPRPYPVLAEGIRVADAPRPVAPAAPPVEPVAAARPTQIPAPLSSPPAVAVAPVRATVVPGAMAKFESRSASGSAAAVRVAKVRSEARRGKSRSHRSLRWRLSLVLSLVILGVGGWLLFRDVYSRLTLPEHYPLEEVATAPDTTGVMIAVEPLAKPAEKSEAPAPKNVIEALAPVSVGANWDMSATVWSSEAAAGAAASAMVVVPPKEAAPVVTPLLDGPGPAPSEAFMAYAAILKITVVVRGEKVRATINGTSYTEGELLDAGLGIRLIGRDSRDRALIFEDATRARVKVAY